MEFALGFGFAQLTSTTIKNMDNNKSSSLKAAQIKDIYTNGRPAESGYLQPYGTTNNNNETKPETAKVVDSFVVIDDYLSSQPSTKTSKTTEHSSNAGNKSKAIETVQQAPRIEDKYIVHPVANKETAQGLAIRYHVSIAEVKKLNKLWSEGELFGRKEILIPKTEESVAQAKAIQARLANPSSNNTSNSNFAPRDLLTSNNILPNKEVLQTFMEVTKTDELIAQHFLQEKNWNYSKALELFYSQKERTEKYNKERNTDEKYDHLYQKQSLRDELRLTSGPAPPSEAIQPHWTNIRKSMQDKMAQEAEDLFDL